MSNKRKANYKSKYSYAKSSEAKRNMTNQLKAQLGFYMRDLTNETKSLSKALSYRKYGWSGTLSMINQHKRGVQVSRYNIARIKIRIRKRFARGEIFQIL